MGYQTRFFKKQAYPDVARGLPQPQRSPRGRARRGTVAAMSGLLAEERVAAHYGAHGYELLARRWRGKAGEIDLVCKSGDALIFVEVKAAPAHAQAAERLLRRQMDRICMAACEFCGKQPAGLLSEMRFDAALVDALGRIQVVENAFGG